MDAYRAQRPATLELDATAILGRAGFRPDGAPSRSCPVAYAPEGTPHHNPALAAGYARLATRRRLDEAARRTCAPDVAYDATPARGDDAERIAARDVLRALQDRLNASDDVSAAELLAYVLSDTFGNPDASKATGLPPGTLVRAAQAFGRTPAWASRTWARVRQAATRVGGA